ncbi:3-deoxy-D-manno-octulosonic acid transferase [Rhodobacteraceae bacterium 2CG4]|uniref:3-deoxy-D-manno-octulosonic acid transferase n=1 Tax=Halovulum marinum TaxID=2662447 RepID=A0A6L5Z7B4_9RHOB|nr:3-deoxy-D-manno-octulosonic acid transferase [Halovulum marinum]MSU91935.1 3-deoxy-D-manno-octulosonic acid transferase [Halovulum marinum]
MPRSLALALVLAASELAPPFVRGVLRRRLSRGKEDPDRLHERLGRPAMPRPEGRLAWFHAASVGESVSLLALVETLLQAQPDLRVMITTGTRTSAELIAERLPARAFHQYVPVDTGPAVRRFLAHWRPDLAVWTESELWPRLLVATRARGIPALLINARMSARSARRMGRLGAYGAALLGRFDAILAQDDAQAERLLALGAPPGRVEVTGSLKDTAQPLPHEPNALKTLVKTLAGRTVWLAASTHEGEEEMVSRAHREARRSVPGLLLILAPRHPERGPRIASDLRAEGWTVAVRSEGGKPDRNTDIYLADTLGEMGLWYRIASVSFIGGSLVDVGGHNPFEPALLGSAILTGPFIQNFETAYTRFRRAGAAVLVPHPGELGAKLAETLPPDRAAALATAAWSVSSEGADVTRRVLAVIERHLPPAPAPAPASAPGAPGTGARTDPEAAGAG